MIIWWRKGKNVTNFKPAITVVVFCPQRQQGENKKLTYDQLLSWYDELISKFLLVYTPSAYGETLAFI